MRRCFECGREKLIAAFSIGYKGLPSTECKACLALRGRIYRRTPAYRRRQAQKRSVRRAVAREQYKNGGCEAARKRHARDRAEDPMFAVREKLSLFIRRSVRAGKIVVPARCAQCPKGPAGGYRLKVRFLSEPPTVDAIEWLCFPCHWAVVVGGDERTADIEDERRDRLDVEDRRTVGAMRAALTIPHGEWLRIHAQHLREAEAADPAYAMEVARFRERFRKTMSVQQYRPQRYADAMLMQAIGGQG